MAHICIVEDEKSLAEMIQLNLELEGHQVTLFSNGKVAEERFNAPFYFDLIVLDVMLPFVSGLDLCRQIRSKSRVPILFLSAKGTTADRIHGLKIGANDYLPKPFDLEELLLKVSILLNGNLSAEDKLVDSFTVGAFEVNLKTFEMRDNNHKVVHHFSKRECELLRLFKEREQQVVSREEILDRLWSGENPPTSRTIDNYILNFRKLFEFDSKSPTYFHSVRGVGYRFTSSEE
jgi:two-component system, OmpR family, alkaline phosphatase synthesis response regulator PhoP